MTARRPKPGWLRIVGIGPGDPSWITPEASRWIAEATDLVGYGPYLDRLTLRLDQVVRASDNRVELDRARAALGLATDGHDVAVISGGDPGIFAMVAAVFEAVEAGDPAWRHLDISVVPGISAMQAAAARLGSPLGHDFCAISLSDNLKPWPLIARRLRAAAEGGFVIALYNPASKARPGQIHEAFALLREHLPTTIPVAFAPRNRAARRTHCDHDIAGRGPKPRRHEHAGLDRLGGEPGHRARWCTPLRLHAALGGAQMMGQDLRHDLVDADRTAVEGFRALHEDHRQSKPARRFQLGHRCRAAAVLGDQDVDVMVTHQTFFLVDRKGTTRLDKGGVGQPMIGSGSFDRPREVGMLGCAGERAELKTTNGQEHAQRGCAERSRRRRHALHLDPAVARQRLPRRARDLDEPAIRPFRGRPSVAGDLHGKWVRRVDQYIDPLSTNVVDQTVDAAKATDPRRDRGHDGRRGAAGERYCRIDFAAASQRGHQGSRLARTAEDQNARRWYL